LGRARPKAEEPRYSCSTGSTNTAQPLQNAKRVAGFVFDFDLIQMDWMTPIMMPINRSVRSKTSHPMIEIDHSSCKDDFSPATLIYPSVKKGRGLDVPDRKIIPRTTAPFAPNPQARANLDSPELRDVDPVPGLGYQSGS
jgi:hypothetical protein